MPIYTYSNDDRSVVIEHVCSMAEKPPYIEKDGLRLTPDLGLDQQRTRSGECLWPFVSEAMGVAPEDAARAEKAAADAGIKVSFLRSGPQAGCPVFENRGQYRRMQKWLGFTQGSQRDKRDARKASTHGR